SARVMIRQAGRPASSIQVRIWRASGWKQLAWRDQSRGPFGPEIIAYISSTAAEISFRSFMRLLRRAALCANSTMHSTVQERSYLFWGVEVANPSELETAQIR